MQSRIRFLFVFLLVCFFYGCQQPCLESGEGFVEVPGGPVWYRVVGSGPWDPVLCLHGGPGGNSCYLSSLAGLGDDRLVVFYDQLGSGRSGWPEDMSHWRIDRFVEELAAVRDRLGLTRIHLYGHSWGAMLAVKYLAEKGTDGIVSLTLAGPLLSTPQWIADAEILRSELPDSVQVILRQHEEAGTTDSDEYSVATEPYYDRFVFHHQPRKEIPECSHLEVNKVVYEHMWGPTEFYATGNLRDVDVTNHLSELDVPVLFVIGRYDEARPETVEGFMKSIPGSKLEIIEGTAHAAMIEEPEQYVRILKEFMRNVEQKKTE